ncbi:hypothetical protein TRFO_26834 [Tritrichomonas foetus]|uniref:Uncharacterized protein n=1 Tax=Tritrichomonas foetus TaxID=1144522 RepID=A0A1J4K2Q1_9EUKA|nr:hypothetical protein TRFO_26834 [Tritrichomonas foetus]|eukprot:OHT05475.1 hypothetical protein TRFO_26834 [Tritrichomonas foetus]
MNIVFSVDANIICPNFVDVHVSPIHDIIGDISIDMYNCHRHMAFTYDAIIYQTKKDHGDSFINIKIKKYDFDNTIEDLILKLEEHQFSSYKPEICDWPIPFSATLDEMKWEAEDKLIVWISHRNAYWWKKIETNSYEKMKERYEKMEYLIKQLIDRNFLFLGIDIRIQEDDWFQ